MVCKNCKANVKNTNKYCKKCGADVVTGIIPTVYAMEKVIKKQKKHRVIKIIVIAATVILIAVIVVFFCHVTQR